MDQETIAGIETLLAPVAIEAAESEFGVSVNQVLAYYNESMSENPQFNVTERRDDVVGKFEHGWRIGEIGPTKLGGAVDAVWPFVKGFVGKFVDGVLASMPPAAAS